MNNPLFTPAQFGKLQLKNRFIMSPMGMELVKDGIATPELAEHYASRAKGQGVGLVFTGSNLIDHFSTNVPVKDMNRLRRGIGEQEHKNLVQAVHQADSKIFVQLAHTGALPVPNANQDLLRSPSGCYPNPQSPIGEALSKQEINELIHAYADSAKLAQELGYDGVEIHSAHGFLPDQFLWASTNQRTDEYGGSPANRARFTAKIIRAVREAVGDEFPISVRLSLWKAGVKDGLLTDNADEFAELLLPIASAGVDFLHLSGKDFNAPAFVGSDVSLAGLAKQITGKPTITVGSVGNVDGKVIDDWDFTALNRRFEKGEFDLVALGQALLQQSDWLDKQAKRFA